jgi:hypothetical protein
VDLHWTCDARDHLRLFVDGALVAEIAVAPCRARDTLAALARQVRALGDQLLAAPPPILCRSTGGGQSATGRVE